MYVALWWYLPWNLFSFQSKQLIRGKGRIRVIRCRPFFSHSNSAHTHSEVLPPAHKEIFLRFPHSPSRLPTHPLPAPLPFDCTGCHNPLPGQTRSDRKFQSRKQECWLPRYLSTARSRTAYSLLNFHQIPITKKDEENLQAVADYIDHHFEFSISVDQLCKIAYMGNTKLKTKFKEYFGCNITDYIIRKRIDQAQHLLIVTELSIAEIAQAIGYERPESFAKQFHRITGLLPREYRKLVK